MNEVDVMFDMVGVCSPSGAVWKRKDDIYSHLSVHYKLNCVIYWI